MVREGRLERPLAFAKPQLQRLAALPIRAFPSDWYSLFDLNKRLLWRSRGSNH